MEILTFIPRNRISSVMVRACSPRVRYIVGSSQAKNYKNGICCFSVEYKADLIIISLKMNLFSPWYSWKIAELVFNNNNSLTFCILKNNVPWYWIKIGIDSGGVIVLPVLKQKALMCKIWCFCYYFLVEGVLLYPFCWTVVDVIVQ